MGLVKVSVGTEHEIFVGAADDVILFILNVV